MFEKLKKTVKENETLIVAGLGCVAAGVGLLAVGRMKAARVDAMALNNFLNKIAEEGSAVGRNRLDGSMWKFTAEMIEEAV